jgi:arylsulfatase A-like enzyme/Tfp pilus assembly protein PilF
VKHARAARAAAACVVLVGASCRAPAPPAARHVVLVTLDTLRADRVGAYGGPADTTPNLDRIAREGAFARHAVAHVPLTRASHATLLSGLLPWQHGIRDNISPGELPAAPLLAEVLKGQGFRTAAFVSSIVLSPQAGLGRGFDVFSDQMPAAPGARFLNTLQRRGEETLAEALPWIEANRGQGRLFLWLHLYDPHDPYEPPEPFASRFAGRLYDGEVAYVDDLVGRLDGALARLGLRDDTLLVVASDHGEGLGEHGETLHGFFVYETTLAVPLIVRGPGITSGTRLDAAVGLVDLYRTVLDLTGVPLPAGARAGGRSLAPALRGGDEPIEQPLYAESLVPLLHFGWSDLRVLREGRWKYIQAPRPELFDLSSDPGETDNRAAAEPARASAFQAALGKVLDEERRAASAGPSGAVPVELLEKLGALGYVGGAAPAQTSTPGADPKDRVADFRLANALMREGLVALNERDFARAATQFGQLLRRGIVSFEAHLYLGRALLGLGRPAEAARHFEEAVRRAPTLPEGWRNLAAARLAMGSRAEARQAYEKALPLAPKDAKLRVQLGELLRDAGQPAAAIERLQEAVTLDPNDASAWNALGMTLGGNARLAEAEAAFRKAVERNAQNQRYAFNLGLALVRQGRAAEARPWFEKSLALDPTFTPAREQLAEMRRR